MILHADEPTVSSKTIGEEVCGEETAGQKVVTTLNNRSKTGGLVILKAIWRPRAAW